MTNTTKSEARVPQGIYVRTDFLSLVVPVCLLCLGLSIITTPPPERSSAVRRMLSECVDNFHPHWHARTSWSPDCRKTLTRTTRKGYTIWVYVPRYVIGYDQYNQVWYRGTPEYTPLLALRVLNTPLITLHISGQVTT